MSGKFNFFDGSRYVRELLNENFHGDARLTLTSGKLLRVGGFRGSFMGGLASFILMQMPTTA